MKNVILKRQIIFLTVALGIFFILFMVAPVSGQSGSTVFTKGATITGDANITGSVSKGSGSFLIDHPLDPRNKLLYHSFVESPDVKNIYDGVANLNKNGEVVIQLPDYFAALNKDFRYQFFPHQTSMPDLYIKEEVSDNILQSQEESQTAESLGR